MAEKDAQTNRGSKYQPKFRRAMAFAASTVRVVFELVGAIAALIAILQALRLWS